MTILILAIIFYIFIYNELARLSIKVKEGSSGIDVALEKRYDMLSEQIEVVKKFLQHEYDLNTSVVDTRSEKQLKEQMFKQKEALVKESLQTIDAVITQQQECVNQLREKIQQYDGQQKEKNEVQKLYRKSIAKQKSSINQKIEMIGSVQKELDSVESVINALVEQYPVLYSHISIEYFQRSIADVEEHLQAAKRLYNSNVSLYNQKIVMFPYSLIADIHGMEKAKFYNIEEKKKLYEVKFMH